MDDDAIKAVLAEVGAAWLMDPDDEHGQPGAIRAVAEAAAEAEREAILDALDDDMPIERAKQLASLWRAGKLIGGDAHAVAISLLNALEAPPKA